MSNTLHCGAGKANITPPAELIPLLPGLMNTRFSGIIYDELFVRAIAFRNEENTILFVSFDLDKAPNPAENRAAISEKYSIPAPRLSQASVPTSRGTAEHRKARTFRPL